MSDKHAARAAVRITSAVVATAETFEAVALELEIIEVLDEALGARDATLATRMRQDQTLLLLLARLGVADARALHGRLAVPAPGDPIARRVARLASARGARLVAFLADATRREAIARSR